MDDLAEVQYQSRRVAFTFHATVRLQILEENKNPSQAWRICSEHFALEHSGNRNAFPLLGLGKTRQQIEEIVYKYGLQDRLPHNFHQVSCLLLLISTYFIRVVK